MPWPAASTAAVLLAVAAATPIAYPAFPATTDFTLVARWLERQTDAPAGDLLDVRDGFAFMLFSAPTREGPRTLRLEAVDQNAWRRIGGRSAELQVELGCAPARAAPADLVVYAASNRMGPVRPDLDPAILGLAPTTLPAIAAALCTPRMQARAPMTGPPPPAQPAAPPMPAAVHDQSVAVQIGAYLTPVAAMNAITRLGQVAPGLLDHRLNRLEPAKAGGRTIYRALISGFIDEMEAARFCGSLVRIHQLCIVRQVR